MTTLGVRVSINIFTLQMKKLRPKSPSDLTWFQNRTFKSTLSDGIITRMNSFLRQPHKGELATGGRSIKAQVVFKATSQSGIGGDFRKKVCQKTSASGQFPTIHQVLKGLWVNKGRPKLYFPNLPHQTFHSSLNQIVHQIHYHFAWIYNRFEHMDLNPEGLSLNHLANLPSKEKDM